MSIRREMINKCKIGALGEELAVEFLKGRGYCILARNYRCPYGEIDIIATKDRTVAFIEVKTRTSAIFGRPAEAVTLKKRKHIKTAASFFLASNKKRCENAGFQVIEITLEHIEGLEF